MLKSTIEKDLQSATSQKECESILCEIMKKYQKEFLSFIEELKQNSIAQSLYVSSTPKETLAIWNTFSSESSKLFERIKSWAHLRDEYFNTYEHSQLFPDDVELDCILEIGLFIFIVFDECIFSPEDINENFDEQLIKLLKSSHNPILQAAGCHIDCSGYEITAETIYDYSEE